MNNRYVKLSSLLVLVILLAGNSLFAAISPAEGKTLFTNNCASCHAKDMKSKLTGPPLAGSPANWDSQENLYAWVRNSQAVIAKGHPRAVALWNEYKPTVMTSFPALTDDQIGSIFAYVDEVASGKGKQPAGGVVAAVGSTKETGTSKWTYLGLLGGLVLLSIILRKVIENLKQVSAAQQGSTYVPTTLMQTLSSKGLISLLLFALVVLAGYTTVNNAVNLGRQKGYEPTQPIKFSHARHAGLHKIDCQYCHDGARRSKQSLIPATNTCMNCHAAIKVGSTYGTAELTKIYASIGFNPSTGKYIENYTDLPTDSIKEIYTDWIASTYMDQKAMSSLDRTGQQIVTEQWKGVVTALTNENKKTIPGPIEWVRVHNLPDHVYFNHAQHVTVGKVACQTCHGPVDQMAVLKQHSPLSMGWCINCHRQSEVKFKENDFYSSYTKFHEELKDGKREKVTVADIGGLECQKCHY